jgi:antitoxin component of RelBE/YafQ-DinJ toxin-antitoxin module
VKRKLTITVDEKLIPRAKAEARRRGESLSGMVETMLREAISRREPPFSQRWRGRLHLDAPDDARTRALLERLG